MIGCHENRLMLVAEWMKQTDVSQDEVWNDSQTLTGLQALAHGDIAAAITALRASVAADAPVGEVVRHWLPNPLLVRTLQARALCEENDIQLVDKYYSKTMVASDYTDWL